MLLDALAALLQNALTTSISASLLLVSLGIALFYRRHSARNVQLPPGPPGYPIIGNLIDFIKIERFALLFFRWCRSYGSMVMFNVLGAHALLISDYDVAVDLLDKRSAIYSDRPPFILVTELGGWGRAMAGLNYGPLFRKHRRISQAHLNSNVVRGYGSMHDELTGRLLSSLATEPTKFREHIFMYAASTVFRLAYDLDVDSPEKRHLMESAKEAISKSSEAFAAGAVVNFFPLLTWVYKLYPEWAPFSAFKADLVTLRRQVENANHAPYNMTKDRMAEGSAGPSLVRDAIENSGGLCSISEEDEEDICGVAGILYAAGQETTDVTLSSFVLAMVLNPEIQRRAQEEIDRIVPFDQLPKLDDWSDLPYLEAVLKELYRWSCPAPNGIPHSSMNDDTYNGYFIPKGTVVVPRMYEMCNACPRPTEFLPHRFLDGNDRGSVPADPGDIIFGFGRRRCPGMYIAGNSIWTAVAQMLASFDFLPELVDGEERPPPVVFEEKATTRCPAPFKCHILPRKGRQFVVPLVSGTTASVVV